MKRAITIATVVVNLAGAAAIGVMLHHSSIREPSVYKALPIKEKAAPSLVAETPAPPPVEQAVSNKKVESVEITEPVFGYPKTDKVIQPLKVDLSRTIVLSSEVGPFTQSIPAQITALARESKEPIFLLINSPGGSVIDGNMILSAMEASRAPIFTVCTMLCASMAFVIHQYGSKRFAVDRSIIMGHPASIGGARGGELNKVVSFLTYLKRYVDKTDAFIAKRAGMSIVEYKTRVNAEMWLDAEDAQSLNLLDGIVSLNALGLDNMEPSQSEQLLSVPTKFQSDLAGE